MNYIRLSKISFTIIAFSLIIYLINSQILENFIWKSDKKFIDFTILISWLECNYLGFDVYNLEDTKNCPNFYSIIFYGDIWLKIPFNETLNIFYLNILPYLIIFLVVLTITYLVNPRSIFDYSILILCLFNPSTMLVIERLAFDIFVFLFIVFITLNRIYFLNWLVIFFLALTKIYPALLGVNIFLENLNRSLKKNFVIILSLVLISTTFFYLHFDKYLISIIDGASNSGRAGYHYLFSLNTIAKIIKIFEVNYIFLIVVTYFLFFYITRLIYKNYHNDLEVLLSDIFSPKGKLFIIGGCVILFCFITFSNYAYREVFILLLVPFLLNSKNKNKFINIIIFILTLRFLFLFPYAYVNIYDGISYANGERIFSNKFIFFITIKGILDFLLMSNILIIVFGGIKKYIITKKDSLNFS
tara:strand:- start:1039 stop:2283 length:1245 start_codon:yes stop_codon:yes gene_type:complete